MPNNAGTVPTFSGKTSLSLSDLDALSAAVNSFHGTEYVPAAPHRGQRRYQLANFNLDQVNAQGHDVYSNEGMVRAVGFSVADEPYISEGEVVLPMAHFYQPEGSETECNGGIQSAVGAVSSIGVFAGLKRPDIVRGNIGLPLADSTVCGGAVAGLIQSVEVDSEATSPYISAGVLHLTPGGGGGDDCCGGCSCLPAEYTPGGSSTLGLIRSIDPSTEITAADIVNGAVRLPYADTQMAASGLMRGVAVVDSTTTNPLICSGVLWLPKADTAAGSTGLVNSIETEFTLENYICNGSIRLTLADSLYCGGVTGLVSGIEYDGTLTEPKITQGKIQLPLGSLNGLRDVYGNEIPWASVSNTVLSTHHVGSDQYDLTATYDSGYLCLQIIHDTTT